MKLTLGLATTILISSFFASLIQTNFFNTDIESRKFNTVNNQFIVYDLYKPKHVSENNKMPFIVIVPGFQRSKEALSNFAIELSRRDIVVALIDPYAQGLSSSSLQNRSATKEGYGMFDLVAHAYESKEFNYIDKNRIGTTGHSMGGNAALRGANFFGKEAEKLNKKSKLHSIYVSGYVLTLRDSVLKPFQSNAGVSYALYDEGAFRNELTGWDSSNMQIAPEALRFVNWGIYNRADGEKKIELGKYYGDTTDRSLRVVHNEPVIHPFQPYNFEAMKNQIEFFEKSFGLNPIISSNNQIWHWKELFTLINMIMALIMVVPLTKMFLQTNFFKTLARSIPAPLPKPEKKGRLLFWLLFFIGASIAAITFIPMVEVAKTLFPEASNRELTWFFPQRMNNSVMLWATFNGLIGFMLFFSSYFFYGKKHGVSPKNWGIKISLSDPICTQSKRYSRFKRLVNNLSPNSAEHRF